MPMEPNEPMRMWNATEYTREYSAAQQPILSNNLLKFNPMKKVFFILQLFPLSISYLHHNDGFEEFSVLF